MLTDRSAQILARLDSTRAFRSAVSAVTLVGLLVIPNAYAMCTFIRKEMNKHHAQGRNIDVSNTPNNQVLGIK